MTSPKECAGFWPTGAHGPLLPPVLVYTLPLYFLYFFTNIGFVNLFLDNKQYSLYT